MKETIAGAASAATMSESQLLWLVADKAEQCAAHDIGLAVLLRTLAAVSGGSGNDHADKIVRVAESAEGAAVCLRGFITSTRMRAVALEAQARQQQANSLRTPIRPQLRTVQGTALGARYIAEDGGIVEYAVRHPPDWLCIWQAGLTTIRCRTSQSPAPLAPGG